MASNIPSAERMLALSEAVVFAWPEFEVMRNATHRLTIEQPTVTEIEVVDDKEK